MNTLNNSAQPDANTDWPIGAGVDWVSYLNRLDLVTSAQGR